MAASATASSSKSTKKGKAHATVTSKQTSKATGKRGRQVGAVKWTIAEHLALFRIIAAIRPSGNNDWKQVGVQHSLGPTNRSGDACKGHWTPVLKLPKPTGRSKPHPLHHLALAIDADINKANATFVMNDQGNHDSYGELEAEFKLAEDEMKRLKLDFNRPPNFNMPTPDEDAVVDEEGDGMEVEDGSEDGDNGEGEGEGEGESEGEGNGEGEGEGDGEGQGDGEGEGDGEQDNGNDGDRGGENIVDMVQDIRLPSETPTELDAAEVQAPNKDFGAARRSSSWDFQFISDPSIPPAPEAPAQASPKAGPAPFPMSKPSMSNSPEKSSTKQGGATVNPSPRKRPEPKPKREPSPEQAIALKTPSKSKATGARGTPLVDVDNTSVKSNKRKANNEEERSDKRKVPKTSSGKAGRSKGQQPKVKEGDEDIINLISDDDNEFINAYIEKKEESNMAAIAFMDHKRKIQHLEGKLQMANEAIASLKLEIIELKQDQKVQARVEAELARRLAPAPLPPAAHLEHQFDPEHPFNRQPPRDDMMFGAQPMHGSFAHPGR
ncbi:unnamed protein product [Rhizoctonia solani]|uniref:Myb-like domain-containing protein n=1 Tax=Rhizoctonia solani TaxID=456999 RepID=A0A8H3DQ17_9AGAM|nr:unnamed protein product [Rhizoctonia solani]